MVPGETGFTGCSNALCAHSCVAGGGRARRHKLCTRQSSAAIVLAVGLVAVKLVVLKMLPFDNKSEFQIIANLPQGTPAETTARRLDELSHVIERVPEVSDYEAYAGTAAPINFNGLVRQYYLRAGPALRGHSGQSGRQASPRQAQEP